MEHYDFDLEVPRQNTLADKWRIVQDEDDPHVRHVTDQYFGEDRTLPLWVADMDFPCPQPVVDALISRAQHGIYGYTSRDEAYDQAVVSWMHKRHNWAIDPQWISTTPGVVSALNALVRAFVAPGDKVLIQPPVYYPFYSTIKNNGAHVAKNSLLYENGQYFMDFDDLAIKVADPQVTMAILCSPHNPVGRVWTEAELLKFGEICLANDVLVVSDEIHADLTFFGSIFTPFARISEQFSRCSVVCTAPSKTFNLAGLKTSNIIIADQDIRTSFQKTLESNGIHGLNPFGPVALKAAYNHGESWLSQVLQYIEGNYLYLEDFIARNIPEIVVVPLEGTYLVWLDCNHLGLGPKDLRRLFLDDARVCLDDGYIFGPEGNGFQRVNIACPRPILAEALERIKNSIESRFTVAA